MVFRAGEIVGFAVRIEEIGEEFYRTLAASVGNTDVKAAFDLLASEEREHIRIFKRLLDTVEKYEPPFESHSGEYEQYVKAFVQQNIFTKERIGEFKAKKASSEVEALEIGIDVEKDSIIFYNEMRNWVHESEHGVIEEEKRHLTKLVDIKGKVTGLSYRSSK